MFSSSSSTNVVELLTLLLGMTFLLAGLWLLFQTLAFLSSARQTIAMVVELERSLDEDTYYPIVEFTTADGVTLRAKIPIASKPPRQIGDMVPILYNSRQPEDIRENTFMGMWVFPSLTIGAGVLITLIGVLLVLT
ncbi:MAG: DUF3592 domain-containing protein [Chloroflexaceae bacterium]